MKLARMKYLAEQELKGSELARTIIRASAFIETWAALIGEPMIKTGKMRIFGRANNPINFVSADDVARFVELAVIDCHAQRAGGGRRAGEPQHEAGCADLRDGNREGWQEKPRALADDALMSVLMRSVRPTLARQIQDGIVMDTHDMSFDPSEIVRRYPSISLTSLAEVVRRDYVG